MREERGDIITSWLVKLVIVMFVIAFVGYEAISIAVSHLSLDEDARQVAVATRSAYRDAREIDDAIDAGNAAGEQQGIEVTDVTIDDDGPSVTFQLERTASTLFLHRFGPLEGMTIARTARTVPLDL